VILPARVGLGTLRLPPGEAATATLQAALEAGLVVFDTARAYDDGEAILGRALAAHPAGARAFVVTKGGMARPDGEWRPDGRASALQRDCEASLAALGRPIDLYLVHAPDPGVKWATTVRALRRLADEKLVRAIGVCNVSLAQLDEALALAPLAAVQVGFSLLDDLPVRSGVLARCRERDLALMAHSPLGGPRRARALLASPPLVEVAQRHRTSPAAVALAALLDAHPHVVAIPGARHPQAAREIAAAADLTLDDSDRAALAGFAAVRKRVVVPAAPDRGEIVLLMGLPGAGKSVAAERFVADGFERLNRDQLGGSLASLAARLDERLVAGARRLVLDNTYVTRASRAAVLAIAAERGVAVRGIFIDVSIAEAQVNVVSRMLEAHGRLLAPEELRRGRDNLAMAPTALWRLQRALERPVADEGFSSLELQPFVRAPAASKGRGARFVALELLDAQPAEQLRASFVIGWAPDAAPDLEPELAARCAGVALCRHGGGPPVCWCRPPLPGLLLALARAHGLDLAASELHGHNRALRELAAAVGARFVGG
jgi:aryl-alcohol dehydrogenase-like predicted oxidoreductase